MKYEEIGGVTIEDLLRLKRLERPPVEFWAEFEKELRAKQLAAIVQKRSWWKEAAYAFAGLARYQVPLGASAALALAFFTVREYRSSPDALIPEVRMQAVVAPLAPAVSHEDEASVETKVTASVQKNEPAVVAAASEAHVAAVASQPAPTTLMPLLVGSLVSDSQLSPSARSIEVNLAAARAAEPEVARRLMGPAQAFETRMIPVKAMLNDPIAQLNPASEERRQRLLGTALPSATAAPSTSSDKLASHLSDDRLYEQISRYSAVGDHLSLKF